MIGGVKTSDSAVSSTVGHLVEEYKKKCRTGLLLVSLSGLKRGQESGSSLSVYIEAGRVVYISVGNLCNEDCLCWIEASSFTAETYEFRNGVQMAQKYHANLGTKLFPLFGVRMSRENGRVHES